MIKSRIIKDRLSSKILLIFTILIASLVIIIGVELFYKSIPIIKSNSLRELIFSKDWHPLKGNFGMLSFIAGTAWVTIVSIIIAVPLCLITAIYLSEYVHKNVLKIINPFIDILAGIPSVIFGVWGIIIIVPFIRFYVAPIFGVSTTGYSILAGGIVLGVMIIPVIISVLVEVFRAIPNQLREASLSLGATQWQTIKFVVLKKAKPGIIAAVVLGISRALGETMAVLMVVGNMVHIPTSVFDPAYPLPALIANNYGEMLSIPMYDSALMFAAFVLLIIVLLFNVLSRIILSNIEKKLSA
jgi:phosphate transport system permease protein